MIRIIARFTWRSKIKTTKNWLVQGFGNLITLLLIIRDTLEIPFDKCQRNWKHRDTNDKRLYWEMIKMEIRDFWIRFSKRLAKVKRKREIDLLCKLKHLNERLDQNHQDTNLVVEDELQNISEHKTKGAIIRSRARWYEHGERNSKFFVNLEKRAYERKYIAKLKTKENQYLEEPNKILCETENFYKTLYSSQISEGAFNASAPHFINCNNIKRLVGEYQKTCEGLITEEECLSALKQFSKNIKTPGSDGANFICVFGIMLQFL